MCGCCLMRLWLCWLSVCVEWMGLIYVCCVFSSLMLSLMNSSLFVCLSVCIVWFMLKL